MVLFLLNFCDQSISVTTHYYDEEKIHQMDGIHIQMDFNITNPQKNDDYIQMCSVDTFIDKLNELILPEDYEEGKQLQINRKVKHLNQTIAKLKRLHHYYQNVSEKMQPIIKRVILRMSQILLPIDLPSDWLSSLSRISQTAQDGQQWALKCEKRFFDFREWNLKLRQSFFLK